MNRPSPLISYAQNHEDIVLARLLQPWTRQGHWIDVGAGHPTFDSVTRLFSDLGWTGVNIEPLAEEFSLLCAERPNDINLNCAIGTRVGSATLYEGPPESRGTSTLIRENAFLSEESVAQTKTTEVEIRTLSSVLATVSWDIDFIKIDVEGMEADVIASADWNQITASIVVVEATEPNSTVQSHQTWEHKLLTAGYVLRLFDGLNRFYSRTRSVRDTTELELDQWFPATAQDHFMSHRLSDANRALNVVAETLQARVDELKVLETFCRDLQSELESATIYAESLKYQADSVEEYVTSLRAAVELNSASLHEATSYAASLEAEIERLRKDLAKNEVVRINQKVEIVDLQRQVDALSTHLERN